jgi:hypothetical protein
MAVLQHCIFLERNGSVDGKYNRTVDLPDLALHPSGSDEASVCVGRV